MNAEAEFASLRQEMLQSETTIVNVSIFVITVTGAAVTAAFQFLNPLAALFPLLVLYLGYKIVFNNIQTIALIGAYLHVFWEEEHKEFHWETRQAKRRAIVELEPANRLGKHSVRREEWMGPLVQHMIFAIGGFCILLFAYISYIVIADPELPDIVPSRSIDENLHISYILSVVLSLIWGITWIRSRPLTKIIHGKNNMMEQLRSAWQLVKDEESVDKKIKSHKSHQRIIKNKKPQ